MRPVEEHLAGCLEAVTVLPALALAPLDALDCLLAEDVSSPLALPPFDNSAMDGYAVRMADVAAATAAFPVVLPVAADVPAGSREQLRLAPGTAVRIMTGAPVPAGTDAVVPVEWTDAGTAQVQIRQAPEAGQFVRAAGGDVQPGESLLSAGTRLSPRHVALLSAIGRERVRVHPRPRVVVLSTGSELMQPGRPLGPGQIYDANGYGLTAAAADLGAVASHVGIVADDPGSVLSMITDQLSRADLLITSGGVSAGAYDVVKEVLAGLGTVRVRQGGDAAGDAAGVRDARTAGGADLHPAGQPGEFDGVVRGLRPPGAAQDVGRERPAPALGDGGGRDGVEFPGGQAPVRQGPAGPPRRRALRGDARRRAGLAPGGGSGRGHLPGRGRRGGHPGAAGRSAALHAARSGPAVTGPGTDGEAAGRAAGARLTHVDARGQARMVDVSGKEVTAREATAVGRVLCSAEVVALLRGEGMPKGDALAVARLAGIQAAKRTPELVPLAHPVAVHGVQVDVEVVDSGVELRATVRTADRTGVEMEALTCVLVAALALVDMVKAVDKHTTVTDVRVVAKSGGRSGDWRRE